MGHGHSHAHPHSHGHGSGGPLRLALIVTLAFALVEAIGGLWSGSLALISDAGHMLSDAIALGLAAFAEWISRRPPTKQLSYGFVRAEVLAALGNGLLMLGLVLYIIVEAVERVQAPQPVTGLAVMVVAFIGLLVNLFVMYILSRGEASLNAKGAALHVLGDMIGSVGALISGAVIHFTGWLPIDPILSLAISGLILMSTLRLMREVVHVLMEGVPLHLKLDEVRESLQDVDGVIAVNNIHIWTLSSGQVSLSAHLVIDNMTRWPGMLDEIGDMLREEFGIQRITLQPDLPD